VSYLIVLLITNLHAMSRHLGVTAVENFYNATATMQTHN